MIPFSVLDLSPICEGSSARDALHHTLALARHAEALGFERYWLAEHHNMPGIASAATSVVIGYVAGGTTRIRVGSGGVMLPNHAPLVIAEQFGTLEALYPGRIDLGLGRAPGTDPATARALRRDLAAATQRFPEDVLELQALLGMPSEGQRLHAIPGEGSSVPIWILGSSLFGAGLAAALGLPFAFASHFAPELLIEALRRYRHRFDPSPQRASPYAMLTVNVLVAETDAIARHHFTSLQQAFVSLRRGAPGRVPPPLDEVETRLTPAERAGIDAVLCHSFVGAKETVKRGLEAFLAAHRPDELMVTAHVFDFDARLQSLAYVAEIREELAAAAPGRNRAGER